MRSQQFVHGACLNRACGTGSAPDASSAAGPEPRATTCADELTSGGAWCTAKNARHGACLGHRRRVVCHRHAVGADLVLHGWLPTGGVPGTAAGGRGPRAPGASTVPPASSAARPPRSPGCIPRPWGGLRTGTTGERAPGCPSCWTWCPRSRRARATRAKRRASFQLKVVTWFNQSKIKGK
jgi:hypothetical protein